MISADCHANEPGGYLAEYVEPRYHHRIPRLEVREDGSEWMITEGTRPSMVKPGPRTKTVQEQQSFETAAHNREPGRLLGLDEATGPRRWRWRRTGGASTGGYTARSLPTDLRW
jgi:hypothetical protein